MAKFKMVPDDDLSVITKYLGGESGVVLIPMSLSATLGAKEAQDVLNSGALGFDAPYDFGGEPDILVDIVTNVHHFSLDALK